MDRRRGRDGGAASAERSLTESGGQAGETPDLSPLALDRRLGSVIRWIDAPPAGEGPLAGKTVGVKDNIDVAGIETTCASAYFTDHRADHDADVVTRLRAAGARVTAKLNMAEFAVGVTSQNSAAGPSRNPWDLGRVPGGSSGGSGIAVAAGIVDAALGTDTGGSVRLPAAACGVTGLRPSRGSISTAGVHPVSEEFDTVGPMARTVGEVAALFDALSSRSTENATGTVRVGVPDVFIASDVDEGVARTVRNAVSLFAELDVTIVPVSLPFAADAQDIVYTIVYSDLARHHRARLRTQPSLFQAVTRERIMLGLGITDEDRAAAHEAGERFRALLRPVLEDVDLVLTPTMPVDVPPLAGGDGVVALSRRMGQFTYPWSLHDGPTLALPVGFHPLSGMPVGAQLTAARGREGVLFEAGVRYQGATDWHERRPAAIHQMIER
ncbi:amidase [Rhodococcus sp. UNC23MFCrub1.1]|uniref:amidase n=1 Tax=Rhodococcus sp. UNC23MFCrub1.1 TaxID=1449068 RepID=UPI001E5463E6|nr:amidase [Rhodococcus sp. UNC23MFCrub1.1]